ncbi:hypothetical protein [Pseudomonas sp. B22129]|uniref:hypothetical protein n=1 Tax=Pseudomonas sp. B22129 TaxID=3235111 RepID=UPI003783AE12
MSMSINTPAFVNVDSAHLDQPSQAQAQLNLPAANNKPVQDVLTTLQGDTTVDSNALNKLFDMLELVFKALRQMFVGKQSKAEVLPDDKADVPAAKLAEGKQPLSPAVNDLPAVKAQALMKQLEPVAPQATKHDANATSDAKATDVSALVSDTLNPQSVPKALLATKPDANATLDANAGDMSALVRDALKQSPEPKALLATKPAIVADQDAEATELPQAPRSTLRPRLDQMLSATPRQDVVVNNDAKANVHLNVNIDHCYCPEASLESGGKSKGLPKVSVISSDPGIEVTTVTTPHNKHETTPKPIPVLSRNVTTEAVPGQKNDAATTSGLVLSPTPTTETEPGHKHDAATTSGLAVKPTPTTETEPGHKHDAATTSGLVLNPTPTTETEPGHKHEAVTTSGTVVNPNITTENTPGTQREVIAGAVVDDANNKTKAETKTEKKTDLTSPGPAADQFEFRDWRSNRVSNFGA